MFEITDVGWLSLAALALGMMAGGSPNLVGFQAHATIPFGGGPVNIFATPVIQVYIASGPAHELLWGHGLTLGSTILLTSALPPDVALWTQGGATLGESDRRTVAAQEARGLRYELAHVRGWQHFGLAYAERVFTEACLYDPLAGWAQCDEAKTQMRGGVYGPALLEREARMGQLRANTGMFRFTLP